MSCSYLQGRKPQEDKEEDKGQQHAAAQTGTANTECTLYGGDAVTPQETKGSLKYSLKYQGFEVGARVRIKRLKNRKDLNLRFGHVIEVRAEDLSKGRVPVKLETRGAQAPEEEVQVRPANLFRVTQDDKG